MTLQKLEKDYSPFTANRMLSPFAKKTKTRKGEFCDVMMVRVFKEIHPTSFDLPDNVIVRAQFWQCPETQQMFQDFDQRYCMKAAAELAATSDKPVLFFHTKAWKA